MFKNGKWYVACANHHWANINDIDEKDTAYDTYAEAEAVGKRWLCDDDDYAVFFRWNDRWWSLVPQEDEYKILMYNYEHKDNKKNV